MEINDIIYKIVKINKDKTDAIYVFYGNYLDDENPNEQFKNATEETDFFHPQKKTIIFTREQVTKIHLNSTPVFFLKQQIHLDDSIATIKIKMVKELNHVFSMEEIYFFCQQFQTINNVSLYETLTQGKKIKINKTRLDCFLKNIITDEDTETGYNIPQEKESYDYNDILELNLNDKKVKMNMILGKNNYIQENEYPFVVNPFLLVGEYDELIEKVTRKSILYLNSNLLLDSGIILDNTIYLCLASDVLDDQEIRAKIYYPKLYNKQVFSAEYLEENRNFFIEDNKKIVENPAAWENVRNVDLFYDMYYSRKTNLEYVDTGIKSFVFTIPFLFKTKIPLDVIFKLIHATKATPLTKFNASLRQEKIYRLYADTLSTDGRKIPYLSKATIFKLIKTTGKNKSVTVYIQYQDVSLFCEFEENGNITISSDFEKEKVLSVGDIDAMIHQTVNPVIQDINSYIEQSGYHMEAFTTIRSPTIVIKRLTYETTIKVNPGFDFKKIGQSKGCLSSLFVFESSQEKEYLLRFKRVSNYNKRTSQEAFIIEKQKQGFSTEEIVEELQRNFTDMKRNEATEMIIKIVNELQLQRKAKKRETEIKINPGFPVFIKKVGFKNNIKITVENIDDLLYLQTLPIYFDSLVRLVNEKQVINVCRNKKEDLDIVSEYELEEAKGEKDLQEEEEEEINLDEISDYEGSEAGEERMQYAMKFFDMGDEEEDDNNEEEEGLQEGGEDTDDSVESYRYSENKEQPTDKKEPKDIKKPLRIQKKIVIVQDELEDDEEEEDDSTFFIEPKKSQNIDGMPLSNKNSYFQKRIKERDPVLILTEGDARYNSYARTCSSSARRQPVILYQEELDEIQKKNPGFLKEGDIAKYGSEPDKQFYYICPRYWDLKNETVITEEEMKEKNLYDKIIPANAKKVPKGTYIYESKETKQYPNFQTESHPDGYCLPCCFSKWNTKTLLERKGKCSKTEEPETEKKELDDYIKGPEKFPLPRDRWGYLPMAIQLLMKENSVDCQINKKNTNIKPNYTCLLRHGVENNPKQSFVACIADALYYTKNDEFNKPIRKSIKEMKDIIISILTLDNFTTFQNGNLVNDFYNDKHIVESLDSIIKKHEKTKIYSKLSGVRANVVLLKKICIAFENFVRFLSDPLVTIDHTYLWDIVSGINPKLFQYGVNLVILDIPNDDITNNIKIICPTNHYSLTAYDLKKPTLLLLRQGEYYEPLYTYRYEKTKGTTRTFVGKLFSELDPELSPNIKTFLTHVIHPFMETMCQPHKSLSSQTYKMQHAVSLQDVIGILKKANYSIEKQIVNYQNKVIGVLTSKKEEDNDDENDEEENKEKITGFIPCYPSAIQKEYDYVFMFEEDLWNNYEDTYAFLKEVNEASEGSLFCEIAFLIAEDEMIVGFLTQTNQFVPLSEPFPSSFVKEDIPILKEGNYFMNNGLEEEKVDKERELFVKKIKLESQFFTVFRNTVRILLNQYENADIRESIEELIKNNQTLYTEKLSQVNDFLKELVERKQSISFVDNTSDEEDMFLSLNEKEIASCIVFKKSAEKCNEKTPLCSYLPDLQQCQLLLPRFNLIQSNSNNEIYYYARMADEIIRYSRIKSFLFQPQTYLSFNDVKYNLRDDEIILLESFITQDYFEKLIPVEVNPYVKYNNYDTVEPIDTLSFINEIKYDELK